MNAKSDDMGQGEHALKKEWKKYAETLENDLPQERAKVLEDIIDKSESRRLTWDFYDAVRKYYATVSSYDWKRTGILDEVLKERVEKYGSPVVVWNLAEVWPLYMSRPDIRDIAELKDLEGQRNAGFYGEDRYIGAGRIPEYIVGKIGNDYEYLLWSAFMYACHSDPLTSGKVPAGVFEETADMLEKYLGDRYPETAYVEFVRARRIPEDSSGRKRSGLEAFAEKYRGRSVSLFARQELVSMKFRELEMSRDAAPSDYEALRDECDAFMKDMRSFSGGDAELVKSCTFPAELMDRMDARRIRAWIGNGTDTLHVALTNLDGADVVFYRFRGFSPEYMDPDISGVRVKKSPDDWSDSTAVLEMHLTGTPGRYYIPDTLSVALPAMDDRNYYIVCRSGDVTAGIPYYRRTVSVAYRCQDGKAAFYPADYMSGEPAGSATVSVYQNDSLVGMAENMTFNGFTVLDGISLRKNTRYMLKCRYTDGNGVFRQSRELYFTTVDRPGTDIHGRLNAAVYKNMAAFHPGDTLRFKVVIYETAGTGAGASAGETQSSGLKVWTGKEPVMVELADPYGNKVAEDVLTVNEFGSAAGFFRLPDDRMNGQFSLSVSVGDEVLAVDVLTVDEFVLPTFTAVFDPVDNVYFPGDTVTVTGRLASYAGQSLAAAGLSYRVALWNETVKDGTLDIAPDGSFSLSFEAGEEDGDGRRYYTVEIMATDATGESHVFRKSVAVNDFFFGMTLENDAGASVTMAEGWPCDREAAEADAYDILALSGDFAVAAFELRNASGDPVAGQNVSYEVVHEGGQVISGEALSGTRTWIDLSSWPSGIFRLKASVTVGGRTKNCVYDFIKVTEKDSVLDIPVENFFKVLPSPGISFQMGASAGPVWAVVQLFGDNAACLASSVVYLNGRCGDDGSLRTLSFDFSPEYPDVVRLQVFYFRNGRAYEFSHDFERRTADNILPVSFSRFTDKAYPGERCIYEISTVPGVECAVSVSDMTAESVMRNLWNRIYSGSGFQWIASGYRTGEASASGASSGETRIRGIYGGEVYGYGTTVSSFYRMYTTTAGEAEQAVGNSVMAKSSSDGMASGSLSADVRDDFSESLAFYPFLRSGEDGKVSFEFTAGDKLSTYHVSVFAHDRSMNNNALRRELLISLPVTVSLASPAYLFSGDRYDMQVALSNVSETDSDGTLTLYMYDGTDYRDSLPVLVKSCPVRIGAGSAVSSGFSLDVPSDIDTMGLKVVYQSVTMAQDTTDGMPASVSDGLFVTIPVLAPEQVLYESHSALLKYGMSRDSLYRELLSGFVNVSGYGADRNEISIMDMLRESIPEHITPEAPDAISVAGACLASSLAAVLEVRSGMKDGEGAASDSSAAHGSASAAELAGRLVSYQNAGGGFAWLKGGKSSPMVTAAVLEYIAEMDSHGLPEAESPLTDAAELAVAYLDRTYFGDVESWNSLSLPQFLFIRSLYPDLPLAADIDRRTMKEFSKAVRAYVFGHEADAPGHILYKARRAMTLLNFIKFSQQSLDTRGNAANDGFLNSVKVRVSRRFISCLGRYMSSVKEYAVDHRSGGKYFPNAVMPFRGLMESELYAHSVLARLMSEYAEFAGDGESAGIADGIRLWIMVQKETQAWDGDPACILALDAVMDGPEELLDTRVLVLTQKYRKPFSEIKAAGNGLSLRCRYLVEDKPAADMSGTVLADGVPSEENAGYPGYRELSGSEVLRVGDRILAVYEIWSAENRSYVCLTAPRPSSLRPVNQISGMYALPVYPRGGGAAFPYSYREVKAGCSRWFIEVLPEEKTVLTEELTVTQTGIFSSMAADIECLYAPHYRANDGCHPRMESVR